MEKKSHGHELESVSSLFISSGEEKKTAAENLSEFKETYSDQREDESEVEERVSVRKRIAYPDTENAQDNIKRCLFRHLQEDFTIYRIELRKTSDTLNPGSKKSKKEEVLIFLKDSPP